MSVIVTNAKSRVAYNIVRSLGKRNISVFSSDFSSPAMSFSSRYSTSNFIYPSPYTDQQSFIDCLVEKIVAFDADVLIPALEETFLIAKHKELLEEYVGIVLPEYQQILTAHNKDQWEIIARSLDIPVPKSFAAVILQEDFSLINELHFPALVKPKQGGGGWAITQVNTPDELKALLQSENCYDLPWSRFYVQEKIAGDTCCVAMLLRNGEFRAKVAYRQLREFPVKAGQATLRISVKEQLAEDYLQRMLENMSWHGICQADFIIDEQTGIPYLIDVNPRFWGSVALGIAAGVDFPFLVYEIAKNGDVPSVSSFKEGVKARWIGGDLRTLYPSFMQSRRKAEFVKSYFFPGDKDVFFDDVSLKDPFPFIIWMLDVLKRSITNKLKLSHVTRDSLKGIWK